MYKYGPKKGFLTERQPKNFNRNINRGMRSNGFRVRLRGLGDSDQVGTKGKSFNIEFLRKGNHLQ